MSDSAWLHRVPKYESAKVSFDIILYQVRIWGSNFQLYHVVCYTSRQSLCSIMGHCRLSFLFVRFLSRTCLNFRALDLVKWIGGSVLISWQFSTCAYYPTTSALSLPWWRPQSSCLCFIPSLTADWWNQHGRLCSVPLIWCDAYSSLKCVLDVRVQALMVGIAENYVWVFISYIIMSSFWCFDGTCCQHPLGDWIWCRWMLKWLGGNVLII